MRRVLIPAIAVGCMAAAACSGGGGGGGGSLPSGSGSMTGTIGGASVTVLSAITAKTDVGNGNTVQAIVLSNTSNLCATVSQGKQPANGQLLIFEIGNFSGTSVSAPTAAGTFDIVPPNGAPTGSTVAAFEYLAVDGSCTPTAQVTGSSGSVSITSVTSGAGGNNFVGSATIVTGNGDSIGATFTADGCPALGTLLAASSPPPCSM